jgi:glucose-6-phosphate isomerase
MAILTYWYREYFQAGSTVVIPYSQDLSLFPSYLQQLSMESLGKSVTRDGEKVEGKTGDVIWGSSGTNGQHSYFQLLHQGTEFIPIEFIAVVNPATGIDTDQHAKLLSNCIGQSFALTRGNKQNKNSSKHSPGNRPSNTLLLYRLDPFSLGSLLALYEHKIYALSILWDINAFDQWGVELGKETAKEIYKMLGKESGPETDEYDQSTQKLLKIIKKWSSKSTKEA